jgi:uncharacterized protein (DUF302 family)
MNDDYGRRIVVDLGFEAALGVVCRSIREEGLRVVARVDVRDHFWRDLGHDFRRYFLLDVWSPELAFEAIRHTLDVGGAFCTTFVVYELADGETAVVVTEHLSRLAADPDWRRRAPDLASIADRERERVSRVVARLPAALEPSLPHGA